MTHSYQCSFCNADAGRMLVRRPAANICDKCIIAFVDQIRQDSAHSAQRVFAEIQAVVYRGGVHDTSRAQWGGGDGHGRGYALELNEKPVMVERELVLAEPNPDYATDRERYLRERGQYMRESSDATGLQMLSAFVFCCAAPSAAASGNLLPWFPRVVFAVLAVGCVVAFVMATRKLRSLARPTPPKSRWS